MGHIVIDYRIIEEQIRALFASDDKLISAENKSKTLEMLLETLRLSEYTRGFLRAFGPHGVSGEVIKEFFLEGAE